MSLQWSDALAVGHPIIDDQHKSLFERFGAFLAACDQRHGAEQLRELFGFLDDYVREHFREEESLMERHAYPEITRHAAEHRIFIEKLAALERELESAGPTVQVLIRTNKALIYWLTEHIREVDTRLAGFLRPG